MDEPFNDNEHDRLWKAIQSLGERFGKLEERIFNELVHRIDRQHKWLVAAFVATMGLLGIVLAILSRRR